VTADALIEAHEWDERYRTSELIWKAGPSQWVQQYTQHLPPGMALDLASGEGRNAVWWPTAGGVSPQSTSRPWRWKAKKLASHHGVRMADRIH
jgi:hypothetical protein